MRPLAQVMAVLMRIWFDGSAVPTLEATLELRVRVLRRFVPFRLRVHGGKCTVTPGRARDAAATVTIGLLDAIRVALGLVAWPSLLASGALELSGDPFLALRFPSMFRLLAR